MQKDNTIYLEHIRNLEVIGEAAKILSSDFKEKYPEIEWKKMAGMRDKLIHSYMTVDIWATWEVIRQVLPTLKLKIIEILNNYTSSEK